MPRSCSSRYLNEDERLGATLVDALTGCGAKPFVVPAMGSHGGGTAEGQRQVLAEYGITDAGRPLPRSSPHWAV
ncbi:hypothetical protein [Saccharopolyspora sp. ASAGF58]|uniref:hypothetical protein n=2 Tax=Saccharopolyspora TaxID=1835 RepID=UPI00143FE6E5|nr:hypothetical protein [Saccharopolyspora sp. ASAGF58]QIZ39143.1 hypothetical protein FDZ84_37465 [Saccharopolyspora sp. ASAGF58]